MLKSMMNSSGLWTLPESVRAAWVVDGCGYLVPDPVAKGLRLMAKDYFETKLEAFRSQNISNETLQAIGQNMARIAINRDGRFEIPLSMLEFAKIESCISFVPIDNGFLLQATIA